MRCGLIELDVRAGGGGEFSRGYLTAVAHSGRNMEFVVLGAIGISSSRGGSVLAWLVHVDALSSRDKAARHNWLLRPLLARTAVKGWKRTQGESERGGRMGSSGSIY